MAEIRPFHGLRFTGEAGPIENLVAPPYDVINAEQRAGYAGQSEHNVVHLTLPLDDSTDRSKYVKYARSAATLAAWRKEGALTAEGQPAFYRYIQSFDVPYCKLGHVTRSAVIALIKTEPYDKGVVLPHEQTFPKHKEDRLRILEATRAHLECIFGLYEDPSGDILKALQAAPATDHVELTTDEGTHQVLEPITDPAACAKLTQLLADKKVWIADGHHRYETACTFRSMVDKPSPIAEDYMMMALTSLSDPGLVLLPTHRIVKKLALSESEMIERFKSHFAIEECKPEDTFDKLQVYEGSGKVAFGVVTSDKGYVLTSGDRGGLIEKQDASQSEELRGLDVSILHSVLFEQLLDLKGTDALGYTRDPEEAVQAPKDGAIASFLMNPPTVDDMRTIALGGEKMPQKSTYYFPKIVSGLVLWSLNDF